MRHARRRRAREGAAQQPSSSEARANGVEGQAAAGLVAERRGGRKKKALRLRTGQHQAGAGGSQGKGRSADEGARAEQTELEEEGEEEVGGLVGTALDAHYQLDLEARYDDEDDAYFEVRGWWAIRWGACVGQAKLLSLGFLGNFCCHNCRAQQQHQQQQQQWRRWRQRRRQ